MHLLHLPNQRKRIRPESFRQRRHGRVPSTMSTDLMSKVLGRDFSFPHRIIFERLRGFQRIDNRCEDIVKLELPRKHVLNNLHGMFRLRETRKSVEDI